MKIAICLSGQARNAELTYPFIYDNIVKCNPENDFDFFIHTWNNGDGTSSWENTVDNDLNKLLELYKPKDKLIENQINFDNSIGSYNSILGSDSNMVKRSKSMFYSIYKSNELKKNYENENKFKYDCVIRLRFDFQIESPLFLEKVDINELTVKNDCKHDEWCLNDHIAISSSKNMDIYSNCYNCFDEIYKKEECKFNPEVILGRHMKINNIKVNKIYINSIIRRYKSFEKNAAYWAPYR